MPGLTWKSAVTLGVVKISERTVCTCLIQPGSNSVQNLGPGLLRSNSSSLKLPVTLRVEMPIVQWQAVLLHHSLVPARLRSVYVVRNEVTLTLSPTWEKRLLRTRMHHVDAALGGVE